MSAHDELLDSLRQRLAATRDLHREEPRNGLEDLADRNPKLRARVDTLRAEVPGLQAPPMQEPEESDHG